MTTTSGHSVGIPAPPSDAPESTPGGGASPHVPSPGSADVVERVTRALHAASDCDLGAVSRCDCGAVMSGFSARYLVEAALRASGLLPVLEAAEALMRAFEPLLAAVASRDADAAEHALEQAQRTITVGDLRRLRAAVREARGGAS